ncbi:hypothetical protein [Akkermansia sp. 54_46]|uniref:hypothetical protein n=1 Tax=Akkermansia sp. 54_46 TaxID=1896967 RepID=UPI00257BF5FE|nr:hypothetical protein [Akkermansia sp. 54_46]
MRSYLWDPSEPEATRVLAMTRWEANGTQVKEHLYCMHDAMKNVTSLFGEARGRRALLQLPASQSARRQVDQQGSHHGTRWLEFVRVR